ncbi:MAG: CHRD domain-containing protein [Acidobacteriota bacterium]
MENFSRTINSFRATRLLFAVSMAAVLFLSVAPVAAQVPTFIAVIQSGQEVPPTGSPSFGNGFLTFDLSTRMLCYSISFTNLASAETVAHFHGPAQPGVNAGILFDISPVPSPSGSPKTGCVGPLSGAQTQQLFQGLFYINIHSTGDPGGEIRGQVLFQAVIP